MRYIGLKEILVPMILPLFAIPSESFNLKGLLIDAYGVYANPLSADMIQKLKFKP